VSAANAALGGCAWRRCPHQATAVVAFQVPHLLAGTRRGYCDVHAVQVADQPGAVLTGAGGVPVQPELPGLDAPAEAARPLQEFGRW
jgi:hypothetical protein